MEQVLCIHAAGIVIFSDFLHGIVGDSHCVSRAYCHTMAAVEAGGGNFRFIFFQAQHAEKAIFHTLAAADTFFLIDGYHTYLLLFFSIAQVRKDVNMTVLRYDF
jgi:hypothetical protein